MRFLKNFSLTKLLDNSKFVKVISVIFGITVWLIVATTVNVDASISIRGVNINLDLAGTTPGSYGLSIIEGMGQTVDISVSGQKYDIGSLGQSDFVAVPAYNTVTTPGTYTLPIEIMPSGETTIAQDIVATPYTQNVTLTFDYIVEKNFSVTATANNIKTAEGYIKEDIIASPETISLKGPQTEIEKIERVVLESNGPEIEVDDSIIIDGTLVCYDSSGNIVTLKNTTYPETNLEISIQVYKYSIVPLTVSFINVPTGLDSSQLDYSMSESEIEIAGPKNVIDKITSINVGDIDFRKANIYASFDMRLEMPAGVTNASGLDYVAVFIESNNLDTKTLSISNFSIKNEPSNYDVSLVTQTIADVVLVGNSDDIAELTSTDLVATVDLQGTDLSSGRARVTVQIYCTGNKFVWAVGEYSAVVNAVENP